MKFEPYRAGLVPAVVRFWNRAFASKRNFFPLTPELFLSRIVRKRTAVEQFDAAGFIVARDGDEIVGLIHVGIRTPDVCRALDPEWPGGEQGYVAFLYVEPERRLRGIGGELWRRGLDRLRDTRQVVVDGQCLNPFYGNSEGPFTPFWGTPEGVSVEWESSGTKKFLARKGFAPRFKGVHLALRVAEAKTPPLEATERSAPRGVFVLRYLPGEYPELGQSHEKRRAVAGGLDFDCVAVVRDRTTVGVLVTYPLREVRAGLYAIYEAAVIPELRGQSLGRHLLIAGLERLRAGKASECEVLTLPEVSPAAHKLYLSLGFAPVTAWAIY